MKITITKVLKNEVTVSGQTLIRLCGGPCGSR